MATTGQREASPPPGRSPPEVEALIEEARRRQRRRRLGLAIVLALAAAAAAGIYLGAIRPAGSPPAGGLTRAGHLCVRNESSWRSQTASRPGTAPALLLTNFRFGRTDYLNGHTDYRLRWPPGGILISISDWTGSATSAMEPRYRPADELHVAAGDFSSFEGVSDLGQQHARLNGRLLEVWVQARPTTAATIAEANRELAGVRTCG